MPGRSTSVQRIGRALVVRPSWVDYRLKGGETVIQIDPGMAFGTGQHPTTAMCLRALEDLVRPGSSVLDLGSGSGILSIAAAKLGAARVLALDIDAQAVKATGENAGINGVLGVVDVREGARCGRRRGSISSLRISAG
jgi:ribosomal protein L11 methyltransferase